MKLIGLHEVTRRALYGIGQSENFLHVQFSGGRIYSVPVHELAYDPFLRELLDWGGDNGHVQTGESLETLMCALHRAAIEIPESLLDDPASGS